MKSGWKQGQRVRCHGIVYTLIDVYEGDWLGEAYYELSLQDDDGNVVVQAARNCSVVAEPPADAATEEVTP